MVNGLPLRAVLLDLDGTLTDTTYIHTLCWWQSMREQGQVVAMARIHRAIGMGSDLLLDEVLSAADEQDPAGSDRDRSADGDITARHDALFRSWYDRLAPLPARTCWLDAAPRG